MDDLIRRKELENLLVVAQDEDFITLEEYDKFWDLVRRVPSAHPEKCEGCKHLDKWENEVEYGYPSPCTSCKRRVKDHYER